MILLGGETGAEDTDCMKEQEGGRETGKARERPLSIYITDCGIRSSGTRIFAPVAFPAISSAWAA